MLKRIRSLLRARRLYWRIARTFVKRRRCYECGLLGFYPFPEGYDSTIAELREWPVGERDMADHELESASRRGLIRGKYDFRKSSNLGIAKWLVGGVKCGVGNPLGAQTMWARKENFPDGQFAEMLDSSAVVRRASSAHPMGSEVVAVAQTFVEPLVRAHDCRQFRRHRPGYSPEQHVTMRRERLRTVAAVLAGVGGITTIVWLLTNL